MKNILCYGDSNTWGYNADGGGTRHSRYVRWTGVAQKILGEDYYVIEEGLNGRTTVWEDPIEEHRNGKAYLPACLMTHAPLDLLVLMLGSNDLKHRFNKSAADIAAGAEKLVQMIQSAENRGHGAPQVLLIAPPPIAEMPQWLADMFEGAHEKAPKLEAHYRRVADENGCHFLATGFLTPDPLDGLHFTAEGHQQLGRKIAETIQTIFE